MEGSAKAAKEATKKTEQAAAFAARHKKGFTAVLGILLILAFLLNAVSSCSMMVEGIGAGIAAGSYAAADDDIVGAEAAYCAMEQALQQKLDHYEQTHDYDEYHYALDDIGHDPYTQPRKRCVICGKPVLSKSHRAKYCPACSVQERRRRDAERKRVQYWNLRI